MNAKARDILIQAWMRGHQQITGHLADGFGGNCALGVLGFRDCMTAHDRIALEDLYEIKVDWAAPKHQCPLCEHYRSWCESSVIVHMNDFHRATFLDIARKLGPDAGGPA